MSVTTTGRPVNAAPAQGSRPRGVLADRRVQVGGAAALVVVVVALARRGGSSASDIAEQTSGGTSTADTTSTDIEQAISSALGDVYGRLDDISSGLSKPAQSQLPTTPTTTTTVPTKTLPKNTGPLPQKTTTKTYTIKKGDTLSAIARRNKTSLGALKKLNPGLFNASHRSGNLIHPGEKVRLS